MSTRESKIEMLKRHVREGAVHVAKQHALIAKLRKHGLPVEEAEALLSTFKEIQRQHEAHLAQAEAEHRS